MADDTQNPEVFEEEGEDWPPEHKELGFKIIGLVQNWADHFNHSLDVKENRMDVKELLYQLADSLPEDDQAWEDAKPTLEPPTGETPPSTGELLN